MRMSTIFKYRAVGRGSRFAAALGVTIRERRIGLGLSQADIGRPLSRAYVSLVEHGRVSPSLGSLVLISERLGLSAWELLRLVNKRMTLR
jgi:transcriptional regulator with XRE-family HTH domain